jgi:hypothetical protein
MPTATTTARLSNSKSDPTEDQLTIDPGAAIHAPPREFAGQLIVRRQDIGFADTSPGRVEISFGVTNTGPRRSRGTLALVQAAPLGAFVNWRPVAAAAVPALEPGESAVVRAEVERAIPKPLGPPDRLPPARLLTALDSDDDKPRSGAQSPFGRPMLPPNPFDLLIGPNTHWAGNLNVFIGRQAVERHMTKSLRIVPERTNVVMFVVGCGPDSYRFDLVGVASSWNAMIIDPTRAPSLSLGLSDGRAIEPGSWVSLSQRALLFLVLRPPANCCQINVEAHVTQLSTQKSAVVEFSFDPKAAGPGCYVVG